EFAANAANETVAATDCPADAMILDAGPATVSAINAVFDTCKTLIWNGPLGAFEIAPFDRATNAAARAASATAQPPPPWHSWPAPKPPRPMFPAGRGPSETLRRRHKPTPQRCPLAPNCPPAPKPTSAAPKPAAQHHSPQSAPCRDRGLLREKTHRQNIARSARPAPPGRPHASAVTAQPWRFAPRVGPGQPSAPDHRRPPAATASPPAAPKPPDLRHLLRACHLNLVGKSMAHGRKRVIGHVWAFLQ
ncbi:MAG: phosphoglycerate kinase, partial [Rhodobacteraceae bacterium]|nr:phosphoglycerate kinase [Paracoccaceae bacterium]